MKNNMPVSMTAGILAVLIAAQIAGYSKVALAQSSSPVGVWKTIDDNSNKAKSHVQIWEHKGVLYGKIIKLIDPDEPNPLCDKCKGKHHNKPVIGMMIMWNLKKADSEWWEDGHIMDPDNGKTYRCKIKLVDGGKKLDVRGFIGISLLGRTQTWIRVK
ncbi:MAG: DUF2147 domain-containing protein [Myxococcota bacterium]|nr:DUF2147 domain-containing protein [Myxococcota bacterium]